MFNNTFAGNTVTTTVSQTYNDAVALAANTVLSSGSTGMVQFNSSVDSLTNIVANARSLVVNTGGVTGFGDGVGNDRVGGVNALLSLTTDDDAAVPATPTDGLPVERTVFNLDVKGLTKGTPKVMVRTTSSQTYSDFVQLGKMGTQAGTFVFKSSNTGTISFDSDVRYANGKESLTIETAGDALLAGNVTVANLNASGVKGETKLGNTTTATTINTVANKIPGFQKFGGKVRVLGDVTSRKVADLLVSGGLTIDPSAKFTIDASGDVKLSGGIAKNDGTIVVDSDGKVVIAGIVENKGTLTVNVGGGFLAEGAVNSGGSITIEGGSEVVKFNGSIEGGGILNINQDAKAPGLVTFVKSVKQGTVTVKGSIITIDDAETTAGNLTLSAGSLLSLTGTKYKSKKDMLLNNTARVPESSDATILKEGGNLSLAAGGKFIMGHGQKLLVDDGALSISARTAKLGDLAALTHLSVQAGTVELLGRVAGSFKNDDREDLGLGFVGQTINFGNANLVFVPGGPAVATFGTAFGLPVGVRRTISNQGITFVTIDDFANQFHQDGAAPNPMGFGSLSLLQPIANGVRTGESTETQTMVIDERPEPFYFEQNASLSAAIKEALRRMSISPRDATAEESISMSLLRGLLRQPLEGRSILEDFEYLVVVNRLTKEEVDEVLDAYLTLTSSYYAKWKAAQKTKNPSSAEFLRLATSGQISDVPTLAEVYDKSSKLSKTLNDLVELYQNGDPEKPNREIGGFLEWLQGQRADAKIGADAVFLADNLDLLANLINRLGKIGLTKKELEVSKKFVVSGIAKKYPELVADLSGVPPVAKVTREAGTPPPEVALPPPPVNPPLPQTDVPVPPVPDAPGGNPAAPAPDAPAPDAPVPPGSTEPPIPPRSAEAPVTPPPAPENATPAPIAK